ncbi:hypothetical protein DID88_002778 [Monilinia fructigena]|uniref:Spindle pole body component n=1 Tax=Monilinia fructigena TaxID=38457 RepID=A0A395IN48_9HELO|nr:hypothetical protein DID88_002778 [Monilinia fructigena]
MAHIVKLGALTDELVTLITSYSPQSDSARFNTCRETAFRALRHSNYNRTNQFDIEDRLEGLDEKFRVYNEDILADALKERLQKLPELKLKWTSEILHLLLELSNKPVSTSRVEDLELVKVVGPKIQPPLKWRDLVAEDPLLREKSIWRNVDFGADSSDDDGLGDDQSELSDLTGSTGESSLDDDSVRRPHHFIVNTLEEETLQKLRKAQFWQKLPSVNGVQLKTVRKPITELQAVREILFMFNGTLSSLFESDSNDVRIVRPSKSYSLKHLTTEGYDMLMETFATQGSASRFVAPTKDVVVSLLSLQNEVAGFTKPLDRLADIIKRVEHDPYAHAFRYLEFLYDETCTSQMAGDDDIFVVVPHILSRERLVSDRHDLTSTTDERSLYYSLRTRLLWFYYTLYYYLTFLVLEQRSQKMHQDLREVEDIDAMIRVHTLFAKRITDECLLGSKLELIHKTIIKILDLGIKLEDAQAANALVDREAIEPTTGNYGSFLGVIGSTYTEKIQ